MKRLLSLVLLLALPVLLAPALRADDDDKPDPKEKLKELQDYIGSWKGSGGPDKARPGPGDPLWSETLDWSWRFKGDDAWLRLQVKDGRQFKEGEVRYLPDKKVYQLTLADRDARKLVFHGTVKNEVLTWERQDPDTKGTQRITMNVAGDGVRFIYRVAHRDEGRTIWVKDFMVACTKEGESLGRAEKKNECVVSGGVGTIAIAYKGETYWVCCSGCRDAFNENPEKYIAEYKAKKAGKK
jgi:YHS domain-containing protein